MLTLYRRAFAGLPAEVWWLSTVTFVNRSGTMVLPFLTLYLSNRRGYSAGAAVAATATYGLGALLGVYWGGWLADRRSPFAVMASSLAITGAGFVAIPWVQGRAALLALLFVLGGVGEAFRPANAAALMRGLPPEIRTRAVALLRLAINLGMSFGPAAGGLLAAIDYRWLFWVDGLTCAAAALLVVGLASRFGIAPAAAQPQDMSPWTDRPFLHLMALQFALALVFFQLSSTFPLALRDLFHFDEAKIGFTLAVNTLIVVAFEMVLVHRLESASPLRVATWGSTLMCLGFGLLPWFAAPAWAIFTVCVWSVGEMLCFPFVAGSIANRAGNRIGSYMGVYNVAFSLAFVLGPLAGGWAYERFGPRAPWIGCLALAPVLALGYRALNRGSIAG